MGTSSLYKLENSSKISSLLLTVGSCYQIIGFSSADVHNLSGTVTGST